MAAAHELGLRIRLFGSPALSLGAAPVEFKAPPRTLPLLAVLLLENGRPAATRKIVATQLWPDADRATALANLRRHLNYLKTALKKLGLRAPELSELRLGNDVIAWVDVRAFELPIATRDDAERAVALYAGPLLAPYGDEEWLVDRRERYRRRYIELVTRLVDEDRANDRLDTALERARAALEIEPHAAEFVRAILRLSIEIGDAATGLAAYKRFAARLAEDFDEEPDRETAELADRLRRRTTLVALPASADTFVGRADELRELALHLQSRRCIALYGLPGIGKSSLAATLAAREAARFIDGVFWVDLGRAKAGETVEALVRATLARGGALRGESPADVVAGKSLLVVLDECERASDEAASVAATLIAASPGVRVIVTSTRRVEVRGSLEWTLEPLRTADAVALFTDRAASIVPSVHVGEGERATIAAICSALDGIPLAIELAAGRTRSRTLGALLDEARSGRDAALESGIARSVELLSGDARAMFFSLGSFRGEFDARTAGGVAAIETERAAPLLEELHGASLIAVAALETETRYDMLDAVRAFAERHAPPGIAETARLRHAEFFCSRVVSLDAELRGAFAFEAYREIAPDYADVAAALDFALAGARTLELAARTCLALSRFWYDRGYVADGIRATTLALDRTRRQLGDALLLAELEWVLTWLRRNDGDYETSYRQCLRALDALRAAGAAPRRLALCEILVANAARMTARYDDAMRRADAALATFEALGDRYSIGYAQLLAGIVELSAGNVEAARARLLAALRAYEETGARADAALACLNLVECAIASGELELGETLAREAVERCTESGNLYFLAFAEHGLATVLVRRRDWPAALRTLTALVRAMRELGDRELTILCAEVTAELCVAAGRATTAALLTGAADAERAAINAPRPLAYAAPYARLQAAIAARLGAEPAEHAREVGAAVDGRRLATRIEGALREASRLLARAASLAAPAPPRPHAVARSAHAARRSALRASARDR